MTKRGWFLVATGVAAALALAGCGSGGGEKTGSGRTVDVTLTDAGCDPARLQVAAGPVTFAVANDGADAISELEVLDGDHILGEVENLAPGLSGQFSLTLKQGRYTMYCPGGTKAERGPLIVTGRAAATSSAAASAVARYRAYVESQTTLLVARTAVFVKALRSGDLAAARTAYAAARVPYERIEPVAESFGGLDPAIDARAGDVPASQWTGFHPIEKKLWVQGTTAGTGKLAVRLGKDVAELQRKVRAIELEPAQIANGSVELLGEVSKSKITGEEERYSHLDLVDFEANVDGARAAFDSIASLVSDRSLVTRIRTQFADVDHALRPFRRGASFVSYEALTAANTRALSQSIDALAEPLSQVGAIVAGR